MQNGRQNAAKAYPRRAHVKFQISIKCTTNHELQSPQKNHVHKTYKQTRGTMSSFQHRVFPLYLQYFLPFHHHKSHFLFPTSLSHVFSIVHFNFGLLRVKKKKLNILNMRKRDYLFAWLHFKAVQSFYIYKGTPTEKKRSPYHKEKIKLQCLILYFSFHSVNEWIYWSYLNIIKLVWLHIASNLLKWYEIIIKFDNFF